MGRGYMIYADYTNGGGGITVKTKHRWQNAR